MNAEEAARLTMDPGSIPSPWERMDPRTMKPVVLSDGMLAKGWRINQSYTVPAGHVGVLRRVFQTIMAPGQDIPAVHPLSNLQEPPNITVGGRNIVLTPSPAGKLFSQRVTRITEHIEPGAGTLGRFVEVQWTIPPVPIYELETVKILRPNDNWLGAALEGSHLVEIWIGQPISMVRWLEAAMPARAQLGIPGAHMAGNGRE